ncbi:helix-turn-helix domain-containing protein [Streptomyces sp. NPDC005374]|uniref:helix-turn-helix domain-containing protein n=1 Tax=Streptomyces sp. NPDC005374 TaxID=3364713 RepID=UPI0036BFC0AA
MSEATATAETEAFARRLRELKDHSRLSYGTLAKRLHMSTSTLHRYCNGTALPVDYAPVERLARVCRATPEDLVELHRLWILADAARGRRADQAPAPAREPDEEGESGDPVVVEAPREVPSSRPSWLRRRRTALIASVAVVAALGAVAYTLRPTTVRAGDTTTPTFTGTLDVDSGLPSAAPSTGGSEPAPSPSASASPTGTTGTTDPKDTATGTGRPAGTAVPLTVATRPYVYDSPCSQRFLVDSEPAQVGPPATEPDAPRWAAAYGAVSSDEQEVALTVQGTGEETVVLNALHVRVLSKNAPLTWNDYSMGVGCGGGVGIKSFAVDLDQGNPMVTVKGGQRAFPYKVSESDPEVFYVVARTGSYDVRWDLSLDWSSGSRHGTVRIDDGGTPFRTSADVDRPGYDYPLGGSEWIERQG